MRIVDTSPKQKPKHEWKCGDVFMSANGVCYMIAYYPGVELAHAALQLTCGSAAYRFTANTPSGVVDNFVAQLGPVTPLPNGAFLTHYDDASDGQGVER